MGLLEYHISTSKELLSLTNRVRNLVVHWPEDGRYKEAILRSMIRRFLPEKYMVGTGFVVKQTDNRGEHESSRQLDLIIYDNESPILFKEGDFVILTPDSVRGIIEVKANVENQGLGEVVERADENGQFIFSGKHDKNNTLFNGIFSYEGYDNLFPNNVRDAIIGANNQLSMNEHYAKFKVNHIAFNKDWFLKYWPENQEPHSIYNTADLTFSFFISNLVDIVSNNSVERNNFIWFATDKELNRALTF